MKNEDEKLICEYSIEKHGSEKLTSLYNFNCFAPHVFSIYQPTTSFLG